MPFNAIRTVYSYRFPETRAAVDAVFRGGYPHFIHTGAIAPTGGLDNLHRPVVKRVLDYYADAAPALAGFANTYPTPGSEEGIRETMTVLQCKGVKEIRVLKGEYEGYMETAKTRNIETVEVNPETDPKSIEPGYWFISNPSARDGNIIPEAFIKAICDAGHQVFYDLAYMGSTEPHVFDLSHPNIFASVVSLSKPYGVFYDRIGFTFSREQIPSLYGNKWFKNAVSLMMGMAILEGIAPYTLYEKYRGLQERIVEDINLEFGLKVKPSDALLLAHMSAKDAEGLGEEQLKLVEPFKRGDCYRFCLTPYYFENDPEKNALFTKWHEFYLREMAGELNDWQMAQMALLEQRHGK